MSEADDPNVEDPGLDALLAQLELEPPVTLAALDELLAYVSANHEVQLPKDYVAFLRRANGADGTFENGASLVFWMAELLPEVNIYEGEQVLPGCLIIGSDAGDGLYGIDLREDAPSSRYVDLYDGPEWDMVLWRGDSLRELLIEVSRPIPSKEGAGRFMRAAVKRLRRS